MWLRARWETARREGGGSQFPQGSRGPICGGPRQDRDSCGNPMIITPTPTDLSLHRAEAQKPGSLSVFSQTRILPSRLLVVSLVEILESAPRVWG